MNPERIVGLPFLFHVFSTFEPGGPEVRAVEIMNATRGEFRHAIVAINGRYSAASRLEGSVHFQLLEMPGVGRTSKSCAALLRLVRSSLNITVETYRLWRQIGILVPDLVLSYGIGAIGAALSLRFDNSVPLICFEDGFEEDEISVRSSRRLLLRRLAYRRSFRVVVPNAMLEKIAKEEFNVSADRICRIPNGVNTSRFSPGKIRAAREEINFQASGFVIGTVCHCRPIKRLDILLRAFKEADLPDAWLLIVGDGIARQEWMAVAAQLNIAAKVVWAGSQAEPSIWLNAMDIFVCTSDSEQMPVAMLEAMACGKPVVTTDVGNCKEILSVENRCFVVPAGDVQALAACFVSLCRREDRARIGLANRDRSHKLFSCNDMVRSHRELYLEAIRSKGVRSGGQSCSAPRLETGRNKENK
jgi:glycosyltransferase involved in cell wall biosynthesis